MIYFWYSAYDKRTDKLLACGKAPRCAAMLGISVDTLYTEVSRQKRNLHPNSKIVFYRDKIDDSKEALM